MSHLRKSAWHEPEAEEFRRYLKEKNVLQALQPALTLLYELPVKPTDLYEFFAEFLENGARTMVKLSLLRAEHCFIRNEIHVMKSQMKQMKERILDVEAIVKTFQDGTNPLQDDSQFKRYSLLDRFMSDVKVEPTTASEMLLQIENELDAEDEERRDMEPVLKYIEDHQEIDPLGILFDFRVPEPDDQDEELDESAAQALSRVSINKTKQLRSKSIFVRAMDADGLGDESDEFSNEEGLQASALTHGRLVIGMSRLHDKRKAERRLIRRPFGTRVLQRGTGKEHSSESSESSEDEKGYDSASSLLNLYNDLRLSSRLKKDKGHRKLLRVLHAKKVKLLSGGKDWLPIARHCDDKHHDERHKKHKGKKRKEKRKETHELEKSGVSELVDGQNVSKEPKKLKHHHKKYRSIGMDADVAEKEKLHKLLGYKSIGDDEDDDAFLNSFGPNRWSFSKPGETMADQTEMPSKLGKDSLGGVRTNADFLFDIPLDQVLQAQQWIDENFMESVYRLNEPLERREDMNGFVDDDDENYIWLEDYNERDDGPREIHDDNLAVNKKILSRIHAGVRRERKELRKGLSKRNTEVLKTEGIADKDAEVVKANENEPSKIIVESELRKLDPVASVPSLLKVQPHYHSEKRSDKTKRFVCEMFDEQYRNKLMNQFQFDMLDDD